MLIFAGSKADEIPGKAPSILAVPDYVTARGYRYIRFALREDRIVWQGCNSAEDAVAGRWADITEGGAGES